MGVPFEQKIIVEFYSDRETADAIKDAMEAAALSVIEPTNRDAASRLLRIAIEAIGRGVTAEQARAGGAS